MAARAATSKSICAPELANNLPEASGSRLRQQSYNMHDPALSTQISSGSFLSGSPHQPKTQTGLYSEHGHNLSYVRPMTQHPGAAVATFFNGLFTTAIALCTLGTSVTFSYVLSNNTSTPAVAEPFFDLGQIQDFLAISWLLFLLGLANGALGSTLLTLFKDHWVKDWDGAHGKKSQFEVQMYAVFAAAFMGALIIGAFVLLCLVVVAYSAIVGWIALGFTGIFGLIIAIGVLHQAPWPWRNNEPRAGNYEYGNTGKSKTEG